MFLMVSDLLLDRHLDRHHLDLRHVVLAPVVFLLDLLLVSSHLRVLFHPLRQLPEQFG